MALVSGVVYDADMLLYSPIIIASYPSFVNTNFGDDNGRKSAV